MCSTSARPLDAAEIAEFEETDRADLLVRVGGRTYSSEDLYQCSSCEEYKVHKDELNEHDQCEECEAEAGDELADLEEMISDFRHSRGCGI